MPAGYKRLTVAIDEYTYETIKWEAEALDPVSPEMGPVIRRWLREKAGQKRPHIERKRAARLQAKHQGGAL